MYDFIVVGAGIIGLSVSMQLSETYPQAKILVIEKEKDISMHQTGRNSGVIHSGIYYKPGSMKARFAKTGNDHMVEFCEREGVPYDRCGKLIVAVDQRELPQLEKLYQRGLKNGLDVKKVTKEEIREREPHLKAVDGIYVPTTGIVDYKQVSAAYVDKFKSQNGELQLETEVKAVENQTGHLLVKTNQGNFKTRFLINCAGLYSDKIAEKAGVKTDMQIVPFRGEYYKIRKEKEHLVKNLVYPVPNPDFPFLGVHFTRMVGGGVDIGPNAVLSFKREGYTKTDVDLKELIEVLKYKPFWQIAFGNMQEGLKEIFKSFSKKMFLKDVNKYFPQLKEEDLIPAEAGVRAQALSNDGRLLDDFFIVQSDRAIHVCNAPSPAATASLEIGNYIVGLVRKKNHSFSA
ncbi:MAG TPA: L-2-hydroxyglutarate oxidase [Bacillales bacterium]|nr:L-2-hydroxyglutarate oxidase [Bacillales bacterium]